MRSEARLKLFTLDPDTQVKYWIIPHYTEVCFTSYYPSLKCICYITKVFFSCFHKKLDFSGIEPDVRHFEEKFGKRVLVSCNDLSFNLQGCVAENEDGPTTNVCFK